MPKFRVDVQHTVEYTYEVEAENTDEAEAVALCYYHADDTPVYECIAGDATVTNCEEL